MSEATMVQTAAIPIESGDPAVDGRAFRRCLGQFATGVTIITTRHGDSLVGMAVNSFSAVSLDPPLVLWSIRRESVSLPAFLEAGHYSVNVLADSQVEVSQLFGSSKPDKFKQVAWFAGRQGAPLLEHALAHLECSLETVHEGGDHLILVGRVQHYARFEGAPLLFTQGQYGVSQNHPDLGGPVNSSVSSVSQGKDDLFLTLLKSTSQHMSTLFEGHRQALGLTMASGRILKRLSVSPCLLEELEHDTYLGRNSTEDGLAELIADGYVLRNSSQLLELTADGRVKYQALLERAEEFSASKLERISDSDLATARRVLLQLQQC